MPRPSASPTPSDPRRRLPAVGVLADEPGARALADRFGAGPLADALRAALADARQRLLVDPAAEVLATDLIAAAECRLERQTRETLFGVINATGVVIHTNLGRAPLAPEAVESMALAAGYGNLEFDLDTGRRASRHDHLDPLIRDVTGAEAGLALNNGAGAVLASLAALAAGTPVIVSRGELIEIGGGFRVPDIVAQSGARLVEIGTTNRTHLRDYERAVKAHPDARVILRTHPSNFRITGFTGAPSLADLAKFAHAHGMILVEDLGGGALIDLEPYGVAGEPVVRDSVAAGVDLVVFSGDKLLGGPQAGVVAGRRELVDRVAGHPLARALRLDKLSLAALAATLRLYRPPADPADRVPVLRMITQTLAAISDRAQALASLIADLADLDVDIVETEGFAGGGAMAMHPLPSRALALSARSLDADTLSRRLRTGSPRVVGRIERDRVLLDLRTIAVGDVAAVATAIHAAVKPSEPR